MQGAYGSSGSIASIGQSSWHVGFPPTPDLSLHRSETTRWDDRAAKPDAFADDALTAPVREYAGLHHTSVETVRSVEVHRS